VTVAYAQLVAYGHDGTLVLYLAAVATVLTMLAQPMQAAFQAIERMEYLAYSEVVNKSAQGLLGIALALLGLGAVGFAGCWMVMSAVVLVLDVVWLGRHVPLSLRTSGGRLMQMARESVAYWAFGLFYMIYLWIDSAMLSLMTNPTVVGWYGVPTKLFQSMMFVPVLISTAWLPRLVNAFEQSHGELCREARMPVGLVLALSFPICAAIVVGAEPFIHVTYGAPYDQSVPVMVILGLCIPPMYLNIMFNQILVAAKRQSQWTWVMAGATVVNPAINAVLIVLTQRRFGNGAIGAAISLLLTEMLIVAVGFRMVGSEAISRGGLRRCAWIAGASIAVAAAGLEARHFGTTASLAAGAICALLIVVVVRLVAPGQIDLLRRRLRELFDGAPRRRRRRGERPGSESREGDVSAATLSDA
jgi:O-antigen/teichoic acid export membrane protein